MRDTSVQFTPGMNWSWMTHDIHQSIIIHSILTICPSHARFHVAPALYHTQSPPNITHLGQTDTILQLQCSHLHSLWFMKSNIASICSTDWLDSTIDAEVAFSIFIFCSCCLVLINQSSVLVKRFVLQMFWFRDHSTHALIYVGTNDCFMTRALKVNYCFIYIIEKDKNHEIPYHLKTPISTKISAQTISKFTSIHANKKKMVLHCFNVPYAWKVDIVNTGELDRQKLALCVWQIAYCSICCQ